MFIGGARSKEQISRVLKDEEQERPILAIKRYEINQKSELLPCTTPLMNGMEITTPQTALAT